MLRFGCIAFLLLILGTECHKGHHGSGCRSKCPKNSVCKNSGRRYSCRCNAGYRKSGNTCSDVNECRTGRIMCNKPASCVNTIGSYKCVCPTGYTVSVRKCVRKYDCDLARYQKIGCFDAKSQGRGKLTELLKKHGKHVSGRTKGRYDVFQNDYGYDYGNDLDFAWNDPHHKKRKPKKGPKKPKITQTERLCKCSTDAIKEGYTYFAMRSFTKCMVGDKYYSTLAATSRRRSQKCYIADKRQRCNDYDSSRCIGDGGTDYVYVLDRCQIKNGGCDHYCKFNGRTAVITCSCRKGYVLAGNRKCVDRCRIKTGGCDHYCTFNGRTAAVTCSCRKGYALAGNRKCIDVNECRKRDKGGCQHLCVNTQGGSYCRCNKGFTLTAGRKRCKDVNECLKRGKGGCQHLCVNTQGGSYCRCNKGFTLAAGGKRCEDVNECLKRDKGGCQHLCVNTQGGNYCRCNKGFTLTAGGKSCKAQTHAEKVGCYNQYSIKPLKYVISYREQIKWKDYERNLAWMVNACKEKAEKLGMKRFALVFWGECWTLKASALVNAVVGKTKCKNGTFKFCTKGDEYCVGPADTAFVYSIEQNGHNPCEQNNGMCEHNCINVGGSPTCACKPGYLLLDDKKRCKVREMRWPAGSYGILSRDPCPSGWYEFTHCLDTEDLGNVDKAKTFDLGFHPTSYTKDTKCAASFVSFRYCFKGPKVPSRTGGFWTTGGKSGEAYVIKNTLQNKQSDCAIFGREGGKVQMDTENTFNQDKFGNNGLNKKVYRLYQPNAFNFGKDSLVHLEFCRIGEAKKLATAKVMEVGEFPQKFGLFIHSKMPCPVLRNPNGYLYGTRQRIQLDLEDSKNLNKITSPAPFENKGKGNIVAMVCQYDPAKAQKKTYLWPAGSYGILSKLPCPPNWFEFSHCIDTADLWNVDNTKKFTLGLGKLCGSTSVSFRYCFKGKNVPSRLASVSADKGSVYVINNEQNGCGLSGGTVRMVGASTVNLNAYGDTVPFNSRAYINYHPFKFNFAKKKVVDLSFCKVGSEKSTYIEVGEFGQKFGFFVGKSDACPKARTPYGELTGRKEYIKLDLESGTSKKGMTPVNILKKGNLEVWVCQYDP